MGGAFDGFLEARADIGGLGPGASLQVRGLQQGLIEALDQAVAGGIAAGQLRGHVVAGGENFCSAWLTSEESPWAEMERTVSKKAPV